MHHEGDKVLGVGGMFGGRSRKGWKVHQTRISKKALYKQQKSVNIPKHSRASKRQGETMMVRERVVFAFTASEKLRLG